jgi:hypothetical protein
MPVARRNTLDRSWRKSRIAACILLRHEAGRLTARDIRLAGVLAADRGVTSRLMDQALYGFRGRAYRIGNESWRQSEGAALSNTVEPKPEVESLAAKQIETNIQNKFMNVEYGPNAIAPQDSLWRYVSIEKFFTCLQGMIFLPTIETLQKT